MARSHALVFTGSLVVGVAALVACIPHPDKDFEDYGDRSASYRTVPTEAGSFDGTVQTEATEGLYYGTCLSQLAFGRPDKVFNFYTKTKFTPDGAGGKLTITLQALKLNPATNGPPIKFEKAGTTGPEQTSLVPMTANIDAATKVTITFADVAGRPALVTVPGDANPITGRPVEIENVKLTGFFAKEKFCALLNGNVVVPVTLDLEPQRNVCQFIPVKEGDPTPALTKEEDFASSTCPF